MKQNHQTKHSPLPDLNKTLKEALQTFDLSLNEFQEITLRKFNIDILSERYTNLANAPAIDVFNIFTLLHLNEIFFYSDYNKEWHLNIITRAIEEKKFYLNKSKSIKLAWKAYKKKRWSYEKNYYGFRLRWNMRLNRIISVLRN